MNDIKRTAVTYTRLACVGQNTGETLAAQEAQCVAFATDKGYSVLKKFRDEGVGADDIERTGLNAMIKYLESIDNAANHVVIAESVQRLGREGEPLTAIIKCIRNTGANVEIAELDTLPPAYIETIFAGVMIAETYENNTH